MPLTLFTRPSIYTPGISGSTRLRIISFVVSINCLRFVLRASRLSSISLYATGSRYFKEMSSMYSLTLRIPRRCAMGAYTSRHSSALSRCFCGATYSSVAKLCMRSANLIMITRMSSLIAMSILRRFSACCSSREENGILPSFVTPSVRFAISLPNAFTMSSYVTGVSSMTSCSRPATTDGVSMPNSTSLYATAMGWMMYGSPERRTCP